MPHRVEENRIQTLEVSSFSRLSFSLVVVVV